MSEPLKLKRIFNFIFFAGDEILAVNGLALQGMSHAEAISVFKNIRSGKVLLHAARRDATMRRCGKNNNNSDSFTKKRFDLLSFFQDMRKSEYIEICK